jgi:peptide/nickel transport system substrate-binding protein
VAVPYLPTNFNPSTPQGANRVTQMVMEQVWPQAFVVDPDFEAETQGFIDSAEVVSLSPMRVSYVIDPKATWSDGYRITAADFEYNWQEILRNAADLAPAGVIAGYRDIRSISGSNGGKTVTVVFTSPYSDWEGLFANLVPAHIAERNGWASAFEGFHPAEVISGGPFIVSSLRPGKRLVLTRNSRYWGAPAHLQSIVFLVQRSEQDSLRALEKGTVSVAELTPGARLDSAVAREDARGAGLSITTTASPLLWQLAFNLKDPVVSDPFLRAALTLATDKAQLVANSVGLDDPGTVTAESRVFAQGQPGQDSEPAPSFAYSPGEATTLLTSLGYVPDQNGILHLAGDGLPLTLTVTGPTNDSIIAALEQQLQAEWAAVGINLLVHNVSMGDLLGTVLPEGRYQLALAPYDLPVFPTWNAIYYTDPVLPSPLYPASLGLHGGTNKIKSPPASTAGTSWLWNIATSRGTEPGAVTSGAVTRDVTGLNGPAVYADFEQIIAQLNTDTQVLLLSKLDALLTRDLPTLPLFQEPVSLVQRSDIVNVSESPTSAGPFWNAEDWVIELAKATG